jgi:hypothetical protein
LVTLTSLQVDSVESEHFDALFELLVVQEHLHSSFADSLGVDNVEDSFEIFYKVYDRQILFTFLRVVSVLNEDHGGGTT